MSHVQSLKNSYSTVQGELRRLEENTLRNPQTSVPGDDHCREELLGHLSGQLGQYIAARLRLIELYPFYASLVSLVTRRPIVLLNVVDPNIATLGNHPGR